MVNKPLKKTLKEWQDFAQYHSSLTEEEQKAVFEHAFFLPKLATFSENVFGLFPLPFSLLDNCKINGQVHRIPMVTEESSVVLACQKIFHLISRTEGFTAEYTSSLMTTQLFLKTTQSSSFFEQTESALKEFLVPHLQNMVQRGGGYRGQELAFYPELGLVRLNLLIDVQDILGANFLTKIAEKTAKFFQKYYKIESLMGILSNDTSQRLAKASIKIPFSLFKFYGDPQVLSKNIVLASEVAFFG